MNQAAEPTRVVVVVVRSGGLAGLRREWRAEPPPAEAPRWVSLVDECPWDDDAPPTSGADRYVWTIRAVLDELPPREVNLPDARLEGPWRTLVDEVRHNAPVRAGRRIR
ncbi:MULTISPECIES: protealysin inhibitor emfourin [unclassified Microbacterium]|uniref:protealysin inhibitor emfourin n=1 Tax=unclassified Microbacterium TaxID=2609290 RepID=UPI0037461115